MDLLHDLEQQARQTADVSYQERMIQRLRAQLPDKMRRLLDMHLRVTDRRLRERYSEEQYGDKAQRVYKAIRSKTTRDVHAENLYDSILSTPEYPIHSKSYGSSLMSRHLATLAIEKAPPKVLETYGWLSIDMNGVKGMVDCTTYQHVTEYLQAVAQFFLNPDGETRRWLDERKVKVVPLAAGGDEYALVLDAEKPLTTGFFDETAARFQLEMANDQHLSSFLDFGSREVQLEYSMPTEKQRTAFFAMNLVEQDAYLRSNNNDDLPGRYYATCGIGGATLREGMERSVARGSLSLKSGKETFDTGRFTIMRHMIELAEARQAKNKEETKDALLFSDPKFGRFVMRTMEGRELDLRLRDVQQQLADEKTKRLQAENDLAALESLCSEQSSQIQELLQKCA